MARVRYLGILYCVVGRSENLVPPPLSFFGRTVKPISRLNSLDWTDLKISGARRDAELCRLCYIQPYLNQVGRL